MYSRATTKISIFRGQTLDDGWGDVVDNNTVVASGVLASILEQKINSSPHVSTQPHNYRYARLRVKHGTDIKVNDRIYDERLNQTWSITNISPLQNPMVGQDLRVDLQFVG
jgi:hypothetical protein